MFPGYYYMKPFVLKFLSDGQSSSTQESVLGEVTRVLQYDTASFTRYPFFWGNLNHYWARDNTREESKVAKQMPKNPGMLVLAEFFRTPYSGLIDIYFTLIF